MTAGLKSSCILNLGFPYHSDETPADRLTAIGDFMAERSFDAEYFLSGRAVEELESKLASLFGMESAMWCPTGTLAQGIAARLYTEAGRNRKLLLHPSSHLLLHEDDGYRIAHGLEASVTGSWNDPLTADILHGDAACLFVELPQRHSGGVLPAWDELEALKERAASLGLPVHMDGARVWACKTYYDDRSFAEIAAGFESVYVSFYKGVGAIGGAALIGRNDFVVEAEKWRTRLGGLLAAPWPMVCDALRLLDRRIAQMPFFVSRARDIAHALGKLEGALIRPSCPHTNMFHVILPFAADVAKRARDRVARDTAVWLGDRFWDYEGNATCAMEITVGEKAAAMSDSEIAAAVSALLGH